MAFESHSSTAIPFSLEVCTFYAALMRVADRVHEQEPNRESGLGGQLFWAGELDATGRALTIAGNVAGAATLVATANAAQQKQAIRDGVVDFLVTSLDEALRILKNEIRKRETVAVCVGTALDAVEHEMVDRGVRPDRIREEIVMAARRAELDYEKKGHPELDPMAMDAIVIWRVDKAPAVWLPKLDAIALGCLEPEDHVARRWIRLAGRYMGRLGQDAHVVRSNREFGARLVERIRERKEAGEIKVRGQIEIAFHGATDQFTFGPMDTDQAG